MLGQLILAGVIGLAAGSFLNVLIIRFEREGADVTGRSRCPACRQVLRWWEMIPVVSYLVLRGRCHRCRAPISPQYPLVEIIVAAFWVFAWPDILTAAIMTTLLLLLVIDTRTMLLPDVYIVWLSVFVLLKLWSSPGLLSSGSAIGALVGAGFLLLLWTVTSGRGLGFGDVKIMIPLGLLLGWMGAVTLLFLAFVSGGLLGAVLLATKRATLKTAVPFGPFLIAAALLLIALPHLAPAFHSFLMYNDLYAIRIHPA